MTGPGGKHIFGPAPSRRLGLSLGIDVVPLKACSYDCIYCQLGRTTKKTTTLREYVPTELLLEELRAYFSRPFKADTITFSGSGEPTLHSGLGKLIGEVKNMTDKPVAVLTNGSLLWEKEVREALLAADMVLPSLDAGCAGTFSLINRPHPSIDFNKMVEGLIQFRQEYKGKILLEVMLVEGVNVSEAEISEMSSLLRKIAPERIQLNAPVRPPAEPGVRVPNSELLSRIARMLGPNAEIIAEYRGARLHGGGAGVTELLDLLRRRPCTADDISSSLGLDPHEVKRCLEALLEQGFISERHHEGSTYYAASREPGERSG